MVLISQGLNNRISLCLSAAASLSRAFYKHAWSREIKPISLERHGMCFICRLKISEICMQIWRSPHPLAYCIAKSSRVPKECHILGNNRMDSLKETWSVWPTPIIYFSHWVVVQFNHFSEELIGIKEARCKLSLIYGYQASCQFSLSVEHVSPNLINSCIALVIHLPELRLRRVSNWVGVFYSIAT